MVEHYDGPGQKAAFFNQKPGRLTKLSFPIIRQKQNIVNFRIFREAFLRERQIPADRYQIGGLIQPFVLFAKNVSLFVGNSQSRKSSYIKGKHTYIFTVSYMCFFG